MWKRKVCGCVNTVLRSTGPTAIRCPEHKGKRAKKGRTLAHFDDGLVRRG